MVNFTTSNGTGATSNDENTLLDFPKVELHLHLDGALRFSTIFELAQQKGIDICGSKTEEQMKEAIVTRDPSHLAHVLESFGLFMPCVLGDPDAIERVAFELCEDLAAQGVVYFECRYSPHFKSNTVRNIMWKHEPYRDKGVLTPDMVVERVCDGLDRGEREFGIKARSILCCINAHEEWSDEILKMCLKYQSRGVVGIDIAGCAHGADEQYEKGNHHVFREAARLGVHRTVHAGESGGAIEVKLAVDHLCAERIGHGYHVLDDEAIYREMRARGVHFECCPVSSVITGSVQPDWSKHPVIRFAKDDVNFGISTDDPTCFGNSLTSELRLCHDEIGLSKEQLWKCQLNAAKSAFLPEDEKQILIRKIEKAKP